MAAMSGRFAALIAFAGTAVCLSFSNALASNDPRLHFDRQSNCSLYDVETRGAVSASWVGSCARGLASGRGTATFERDDQTELTFTATFANGRAEDGEASVRWSAGAHFEGNWAHGAPNGHGSITWVNGDRYDGDFVDGRAEGQGLEIWANGDRYEGPWHNDVPDGLGTFTKKGGLAQHIAFVDGKPRPASRPEDTRPDSNTPHPATSSPPDKFLFSDLTGKTLTGLDGSSIKLEVIDGGVVRTIASPTGQSERVVFKILNGNLGTISKADGSPQVTGFFRVAGSGLDAEFADGHLEHLALNSAGGLTSLIVSPSGEGVCLSWYPDGHLFNKDERKAAVVAYARRLGLSLPANPTRPQCEAKLPADTARGRADPALIRPLPKPIAEHVSLPPYKLGEGPTNLQVMPVHDSVVHPIDSPLSITADSDSTSPVTDEVFASKCLKVDSDGSYWGFRNHCGYSVQFAYCMLHASDETPWCGTDGSNAATGSVSASGFSTLFADTSLSGGRAEHDFRWVACRGGAGEIVPRLDTPEPATGRCLKPATDHRQQASN
jgi:hypothetical protein